MKTKSGLKSGLLLLSVALATTITTASAQDGNYNFAYTGGMITWVVPATGTFDITAFGAQGGGGYGGAVGGLGAEVGGTFSLTAGQVLNILVGGQGGSGNYGDLFGGGGGGGSFVYTDGNSPLVIAGGGGGSGFQGLDLDEHNGGHGQSGQNGQVGFGGSGGAGGTLGSGGGGGTVDFSGGGGGGWLGNGSDGLNPGAALSGFGGSGAFGFAGGTGAGTGLGQGGDNSGGLGGGGGGGYGGGGGGGGYSGGGGGDGSLNDANFGGGGAGSFLDASGTYFIIDASTNLVMGLSGVVSPDGSLDGYVLINALDTTPPIPEPTTLALSGLCGLSLMLFRRQRRTKPYDF